MERERKKEKKSEREREENHQDGLDSREVVAQWSRERWYVRSATTVNERTRINLTQEGAPSRWAPLRFQLCINRWRMAKKLRERGVQ